MTGVDSRRVLPLLAFLSAAIAAACSTAPQTTSKGTATVLPLYQGAHDGADCGGVTGWVRDQNHADARVKVDIFDGDMQVGTTVADRLRPDLRTAGLGDGKYGFRFTLPAALRDGRVHQIRAKIAATQTDVAGTPKRLTCDGQVPMYEGGHDTADCAAVGGWIWDKNHPDTSLQVDVFDGGKRLATVSADQLRRDLLEAGLGTGKYGFNYPLPPALNDGQSHVIRVAIAGTGVNVPNTPKSIMCAQK